MDAGTLTLLLQANAKGLKKTLGDSDKLVADFAKKAEKSAGKMRSTVGVAMLAMGAAIVGTIAGLVKLGEEFQAAEFKIRKMTGATGPALAALNENMKNVYVQTAASMTDVATAIGAVSQRTGQTGKALEDLTLKEVKLSRITGEDLTEQIRQTTRLFGDWSIATDKQGSSLDWLLKVSEQTGIGVTALSTTVVQFGAPLRQLGFDFETATAMLGKWEREGVNITTVLAGMKRGLGNFAKAGEEPREALLRVTQAIKDAGSIAEANTIAFAVFGQRAGPDMAAAIREGRFDLDGLLATLRGSSETIDGAAKDTMTLGTQFTKLRHQIETAAEPLAKNFLGAVERGMPTIKALAEKLIGLVTELSKLPPGLLLAGAGLSLLVTFGGGILMLLPQLAAGFAILKTALLAVGASGGAAAGGVALLSGALMATGYIAILALAGKLLVDLANGHRAAATEVENLRVKQGAYVTDMAVAEADLYRQGQALNLTMEERDRLYVLASQRLAEYGGNTKLLRADMAELVKSAMDVVGGTDELSNAWRQAERAFSDTGQTAQKALDDIAAAEKKVDAEELAKHITETTASIEAMINPMDLWTQSTDAAKAAAEEHATALGLEGQAVTDMVDEAEGSLTDYLARLEATFKAQQERVRNLHTLTVELLKQGLTPAQAQALVDEAATYPAEFLAQIVKAEPAIRKRWVDDTMKAQAQAGAEGQAAFHDAFDAEQLQADLLNEMKDGWLKSDFKSPGNTGGLAFADGWIQGANKTLSMWQPPNLGGITDGWLNSGKTAGAKAAGGMDPNWLMQMMGIGGALGAGSGTGGMAGSTSAVWDRLKLLFPGASFMGGYDYRTIAGTNNLSDHAFGKAFDVGGSPAYMRSMANWLTANQGRLGVKYVIYNRQYWGEETGDWVPYTGSNPHTDHVHVSTYDSGGILPPGKTLATNYTGANEVVLPAAWIDALTGEVSSLVDSIRALVNADSEIAAGLKGQTANQQILDAFSSRTSTAGSYISRESSRLGMQQASGADLATQTATLMRQIEFIDKAIAEAQIELQVAKDRGMDASTINDLASSLFDLQRSGADARQELEALARVPLEQAADRWANALSQTNTIMDLMGNASNSYAQQSGMFPQLMGQLGGGYQSALDLMNASTSPSDIMGYGGDALSGLSSMFDAEKDQLDRALDDTLKSTDASEDAWNAAWDARGDALDAEIDRESRALSDQADAQREALQQQLTDLDAAHRDELDALDAFYDDKLRVLEDREREITRAQQRNKAQKAVGGLEDQLRILQGQGYYTESDIARMRELETQIQEGHDAMAEQDAAWAREDERTRLEREKQEAVDSLTQQQESERIALEDQVRAAEDALSAQLEAQQAALDARRAAYEQERVAAEQQFEAQRQQAQAAYQAEIDAAVEKYQKLMQAVIDQENALLGQTGAYQNAGYTLGVTFAQGILDAIPAIEAAAKAAAQAAADYLELNSPAKAGPLSSLDTWWDAFIPTISKGFQVNDLIRPVMDTYGPSPQSGTVARSEDRIDVFFHNEVSDKNMDALADAVSTRIRRKVDVLSRGY